MDYPEFRLKERQRSWANPEFALPPPDATQDRLRGRWQEIAALRERVTAEIDRRQDEWIALEQELVRIPSVNPSEQWEKPLVEHVAGLLRDLRMDVRTMEPQPGRASALGTLPGSHRNGSLTHNLLFYAHADTVPVGDEANWTYPPFSATIAGGRLWGRGSKDCKLGMMAAIAAARVFRDLGVELSGDLLITTPADEETGGHLGIAEMIDAGWLEGVEAAVYGEGRPDQLTIGARGGIQFRVTVHGKSAHTARKHLGVNAIIRACRVAQAIEPLTFDDCAPHPLVPDMPNASVNLISGGFKLNVVPDRCEVDVDLRFPPGYDDERALARVRQGIEQALRSEIPDLQYEISPLSAMRPYAVDPRQPLIQALSMCVEQVTGRKPQPIGMPASSDARWIYLDGKIPIVNFSHGNESGHLPNEYVDLQAIADNVKSYALLALMLLA